MNPEYTGMRRSEVMKLRAVQKVPVQAVNNAHEVYLYVQAHPGAKDLEIVEAHPHLGRAGVILSLKNLAEAGYLLKKDTKKLTPQNREIFSYKVSSEEYKPRIITPRKVAPNDKKAQKSVQRLERTPLGKAPKAQSQDQSTAQSPFFEKQSSLESTPKPSEDILPPRLTHYSTAQAERSIEELFQEIPRQRIEGTLTVAKKTLDIEKMIIPDSQTVEAQAEQVLEDMTTDMNDVMICLQVGKDVITPSYEEAKKLWKQLHAMFGRRVVLK